MIEIKGVNKHYGQVQVLKNCTTAVGLGQINADQDR
jgi:ABC-type polar amino acid transport system ATPase subunit